MKKGLIYVYTGNGKGKTTSAVGHCLRARSRGLTVLFAQFMKHENGGEVELLKQVSVQTMVFENVVSPHFNPEVDLKDIRQEALKSLESLVPILGGFDLVVLDEFNCLIGNNIITQEEALDFLKNKPEPLELIVTGRGAPEGVIEFADLVTDMREVKHPSSIGHPARRGIDF